MSFDLRANVMKMRPYSPGKPIEEVRRELGLTQIVKLASNENPLGPSPKAAAAAKQAADSMHLYPDAAGHELRTALSQKFEVPAEHIVLGNGSDELIKYLGDVFLEGRDTALLMGDPAFVRYASSAQLADAELIKVPLDSQARHDAKAMAEAITPNTRLVWVANPNNPTGTAIPASDIDLLLEALPEGALLVLDEAYYEFGKSMPGAANGADYLKAGKPVAALRTFSKAYGLAGIRIGFGFFPAEVADAINRAREPFNANSLAQAAAIAALDDDEHLRRTLEINRKGIERVEVWCANQGLETVESYANFVLINLKQPAAPIFEALLKEGVITRSGDAFGMPQHLRVSIGTEDEMSIFLAAMEKVLSD